MAAAACSGLRLARLHGCLSQNRIRNRRSTLSYHVSPEESLEGFGNEGGPEIEAKPLEPTKVFSAVVWFQAGPWIGANQSVGNCSSGYCSAAE